MNTPAYDKEITALLSAISDSTCTGMKTTVRAPSRYLEAVTARGVDDVADIFVQAWLAHREIGLLVPKVIKKYAGR